MRNYIIEVVARNIRVPEKGILGFLVAQLLNKLNIPLEVNAARLSNILKDHHVLEVGYGAGFGLQAAAQYVKDGSGKIYGLDISPAMFGRASKLMAKEIAAGKVELCQGTVMNLPYSTNKFDAVFHCNCYYFWPDQPVAAREIFRVMKPHTRMVTTINLDVVKKNKERGLFKYGNTDPVNYMAVLEEAGFKDVRLEYLNDKDFKFQAIFADVGEKKEYKDILESEEPKTS